MNHIQDDSYALKNTCVAFGVFDGVHLGHKKVVETLVNVSRSMNLSPVLISFIKPQGQKILTTEKEKATLLRAFPLEAMISMSERPIDASFFSDVLSRLSAKAVVLGESHASLAEIKRMSLNCGIDVIECDTVMQDSLPVCAKRIHAALSACKMEETARLLGHPFIIAGRVVAGKQLGRTVALPTANIDFTNNKLLPQDGSYITVTVVDGVRRAGLTNIGKRPTVDSFDYTTIENHILNFSGNLYGKELVVELHRFIRGVEKFDSLKAMREKVAEDIRGIDDYVKSIL